MDAETMNKRTMSIHSTWLVFAVILASSAFAEDAGQVIFAKGSVTAEREPPAALSPIHSSTGRQDTLGRAQPLAGCPTLVRTQLYPGGDLENNRNRC